MSTYDYLSRRRFLWLSAGASASLLLPSGCGGGGEGGGNSFSLTEVPRAEPSGTLRNQVDQFSTTVDRVASGVLAISSQQTEAEAFLQAGRGRAGAPSAFFFRATLVGGAFARATVEKLADAAMGLDDLGYVAQRIEEGKVRSGTVTNPQWLAAMLQKTYLALCTAGGILTTFQMAGLSEAVEWVSAATDPKERLIRYALVADTYNRWVRATFRDAGMTLDPTYYLNLSAEIVPEVVPDHLGQLARLVPALPMGPGLRPSDSRATSTSLALQTSFSEELGALVNGGGTSAWDSSEASRTQLRLDLKRGTIAESVSAVAANIEAGGSNPDALRNMPILQTLQAELGAATVTQRLAEQALQLVETLTTDRWRVAVDAALSTGKALIKDLVNGSTAVSTIVWSNEPSQVSAFAATAAAQAAAALRPQVQQASEAADLFAQTTSPDGQRPPGRELPAVTNPSSYECDQLAGRGVELIEIEPPRDHPTCDLDATGARKVLGGAPSRAVSNPDRTLANLEVAVLALIVDLGARNLNTVATEIRDNRIRFYGSAFALLIRRDPGQTSVVVPAITSAQLLCSSPGFIPMRSDSPKDLTTLESLPLLQSIGDLGSGVKFDVR